MSSCERARFANTYLDPSFLADLYRFSCVSFANLSFRSVCCTYHRENSFTFCVQFLRVPLINFLGGNLLGSLRMGKETSFPSVVCGFEDAESSGNFL